MTKTLSFEFEHVEGFITFNLPGVNNFPLIMFDIKIKRQTKTTLFSQISKPIKIIFVFL